LPFTPKRDFPVFIVFAAFIAGGTGVRKEMKLKKKELGIIAGSCNDLLNSGVIALILCLVILRK